MFSCDQLFAALVDGLDDPVSEELRARLESHLADCSTCTVVYDTTRRTLRIVTDSESFELPPGIAERLRTRVMAAIERADR